MPATAGRVRMPANNRVHSSAALQTHGIWQSAIGYDPYAPSSSHHKSSGSEPETENTYACFQQLLSLARITGSSCAQEAPRGTCKKCGRVGHLTFQCRNFLSVLKDDNMDKNPNEVHAPVVLCGVDKLKGKGIEVNGKTAEESSEEEESESSDSDYDSEIERAIAERYGTRISSKLKLSRKKKVDFDEDGSDIEKSGRSKRRRKERVESDENGSGRKRRKEKKRRRREMSSDEDDERKRRKSRKEKRRRSHRHSIR